MRLLLTIKRHALPDLELVWIVSEDPGVKSNLTVARLLEQINPIVPLESDHWGLDHYVVSLGAYECLHFNLVHDLFKDDDCVTIRYLQTKDVRERRLSGREQITHDGRHIMDGVPFGKPLLRQPSRPHVHIPVLKRKRIEYEEDDDATFDQEGQEMDRMFDEQQLRIKNAVEGEFVDADEDEDMDFGPILEYEESDDEEDDEDFQPSEGEEIPEKAKKDAPKRQKSVRFQEDSSDRQLAIDAAKPVSSTSGKEEKSKQQPSGTSSSSDVSSSSSSDDSESDSDSDSGSNSAADLVPPNSGKAKKSKQQPSGTNSSSDISSSSSSDDSESDSDSDTSSGEDSPEEVSSEPQSKKPSLTKSKKLKKPVEDPMSNAAANSEVRLTTTTNITPAPVPQSNGSLPFEGHARTNDRNIRRRERRRLENLRNKGILPIDATRPDMEQYLQGKLEDKRQALLERVQNMDTNAESSTPAQASNKSTAIPASQNASLQEQGEPARKRVHQSYDRAIYSALGVRAPKTEADKERTRAKLTARSERRRKIPQAQAVVPEEEYGADVDPSSDAWKDQIIVSAVECLHKGTTLSAPPYPFAQRWDPQQQKKYRWGSTPGAFGSNKGRNMGTMKRKQDRMREYGRTQKKRHFDYAGEDDSYTHLNYDEEEQDPISERQKTSQDDSAASNQLMNDMEQSLSIPSQIESENTIPDLPVPPKNLDDLPALTMEAATQGAVIVFKQLEVSEETKWEPAFSPLRTAMICSAPQGGALEIQLAVRDRMKKGRQYAFGEKRILQRQGLLDADGEEDEGEEDEGFRDVQYTDLVEAKLLEPGPVDPGMTATSQPSVIEETQLGGAGDGNETLMPEEDVKSSEKEWNGIEDEQAVKSSEKEWNGIEDEQAAKSSDVDVDMGEASAENVTAGSEERATDETI
ncbi:hypothetical protein K402DRAFT_421863 [Aulographum hederae CBS 113979]|uniref:DUF7357 domain-containing protein n=1 Tax=Aulographum hederae CBS 113979 TaxID=1176131 RepID=A0A6G1GXN5_9PEZI|nr:hypothetical protein K402DRAFT_421863 [Aulographum hederae CBS 113979]